MPRVLTITGAAALLLLFLPSQEVHAYGGTYYYPLTGHELNSSLSQSRVYDNVFYYPSRYGANTGMPSASGEHPYDVRQHELAKRKAHAKAHTNYPYRRIQDYWLYSHPAYAKSAALHPYFRYRVQVPQINALHWRGENTSNSFNDLSSDTRCVRFGPGWTQTASVGPYWNCLR